MTEKVKQNIYQMYQANDNKVGFWVKRNSWSWQTAQIVSIDGKTEGALIGNPPYFNSPKVIGRMGGVGKEIEITSPGTYGYEKV
jgi:hypothetical protein